MAVHTIVLKIFYFAPVAAVYLYLCFRDSRFYYPYLCCGGAKPTGRRERKISRRPAEWPTMRGLSDSVCDSGTHCNFFRLHSNP